MAPALPLNTPGVYGVQGGGGGLTQAAAGAPVGLRGDARFSPVLGPDGFIYCQDN
jgi:hypothetical protein